MGRFNWQDKTPCYRTNSFKTEATAVSTSITINPTPSVAAPTTWEMGVDPDASGTNRNCFMMEVINLDCWVLVSGENYVEPGTMVEIGFRQPGVDASTEIYENYPTLTYGSASSPAYHDLYRTFEMGSYDDNNSLTIHRNGNPLFEIPIGRTAFAGTQTPEDYEYLFWVALEASGSSPTWFCYTTITWRMKGCDRQIKTDREDAGSYAS